MFINISALQLLLLSPVYILVIFALFMLVANSFLGKSPNIFKNLSLIALSLSFLSMLFLDFKSGFFELLSFDYLALCSWALILFAGALFALAEKSDLGSDFYGLFLLMIAGFMIMAASQNLVVVLIALECGSLALYTLIAMRGGELALKAAIKYFAYGAISTAFFALACVFYYLDNATLSLSSINAASHGDLASFTALIIFLAVLSFKLSLAPFHLWLKDVYAHASANLAGFISVGPKIVALVFAYRLFINFTGLASAGAALSYACAFAILAAGLGAIRQQNAKALFVYSSISHSAFILASLAALVNSAALSYNNFATAAFFYWFIFIAANIALFMFLSHFKSCNYKDFYGSYAKNKSLALLIVLLLLSLAAIPPFGIFWGKAYLILLVLKSGDYLLACTMALGSVFMLYAYLQFINAILFVKPVQFLAAETLAAKTSDTSFDCCTTNTSRLSLGRTQALLLSLAVTINVFGLVFVSNFYSLATGG